MAYKFNATGSCTITGSIATAEISEYTYACWIRPYDTNNRIIILGSTGNPVSTYDKMIKYNTKFMSYSWTSLDGAMTVTGTTNITTSKWYHVAATGKQGGQLRLYVNGQSEGSPINITGTFYRDTLWWIAPKGELGGASDSIIGELSELSFWKKELTADEIKRIATSRRYMPLNVQRSSLVAYFPMNDRLEVGGSYTNWQEWIGGHTQVHNGTQPVGVGDNLSYP